MINVLGTQVSISTKSILSLSRWFKAINFDHQIHNHNHCEVYVISKGLDLSSIVSIA